MLIVGNVEDFYFSLRSYLMKIVLVVFKFGIDHAFDEIE